MVAPERTLLSTLRRDSLDMADTESLPKKGRRGRNYFFGGSGLWEGGVVAFLGSSMRQIFFSDCRTTPA